MLNDAGTTLIKDGWPKAAWAEQIQPEPLEGSRHNNPALAAESR